LEVWKRRVDYNFGLNPIIEKIDLSEFLKKTLDNYEGLGSEKRSAIIRSIDYLNSSKRGYVEDRIFRVCLAWELLSAEYFPKYEIPPELKKLKDALKRTIKTWREEFPTIDPHGFFPDRVSKSLSWDKAITLMKSLADSENIDLDKVGVNLSELKELRDNVAHSGKFKKTYKQKEIANLLDKAVLGLRVIILRKLGYLGNIQKPTGNFLYRTDISAFFKAH